jgi:hypothetical protein
MSNVPQAKRILDKLLGRQPISGSGAQMTAFVRRELLRVRGLLDRERPAYRASRTLPTMTREQVSEACALRERGWPINRIARHLGTNIGRVSEAINGKRDGI